MMKTILLFAFALTLSAQNARVQAARDALKSNDYAAAQSALRDAIETEPGLMEAHELLRSVINQKVGTVMRKPDAAPEERESAAKQAREEAIRQTEELYNGWLTKFPKEPAIPWVLSEINMYRDYEKLERYAKQAIALDPKFSQAYMTLSLVEEARGDEAKRLEYLKRATDSHPDDPNWAFYYASALRTTRLKDHIEASAKVSERFPASERGAQALYWLGFEAEKTPERLQWLERLRSKFPPEKFTWSESGVSILFDIYARTEPAKALELAQDMVKRLEAKGGSDFKNWQTVLKFQESMQQGRALLADNMAADASALLKDLKTPRFFDAAPLQLLTADAAASAGNVRPAYDGLLTVMTTSPADNTRAALFRYGARLGKSTAQVDGDVREALEKTAKPSHEFSLPIYGAGRKISIAEYKGKVVLLNFWYPFCGPCRGEFPYLQNILDKYGPKGFVILSINVHPEEDQFVLPYIRNRKWGFVPVKADEDFASKNYQARGYPTNFLLDQQGRIIYKPGVIRGLDAQRSMEIQIETLLTHGAAPSGN
jgi:thiol-disulfide isomerase/thioredoxin/Tfp pilus assembly protein PilF